MRPPGDNGLITTTFVYLNFYEYYKYLRFFNLKYSVLFYSIFIHFEFTPFTNYYKKHLSNFLADD